MDTINSRTVLHVRDKDYNSYKILILRKYLREFASLHTVTNVSERTPVLEVGSNKFEYVNTILRMYSTLSCIGDLYGHNVFEKGLIDQWLDWSVNELETPMCVLTRHLTGFGEEAKNAQKQARADVMSRLKILNDHLLTRTYMLGDFISVADIALVCSCLYLFIFILAEPERKNFLNVTRWFTTLINLDNFKSVLGEVTLYTRPGKCCKQKCEKESTKPTPEVHIFPTNTTPGDEVVDNLTELLNPIDLNASIVTIDYPKKYHRKRVYLNRLLTIGDRANKYIDEIIHVCGWTRTLRHQGSLCFVSLNDGSCFDSLQIIVDDKIPGYDDLLKAGSVSVSLSVKGKIVKSPAKGQLIEMQATEVKVLGTTDSAAYPLAKKKHTLEHLRDYAHLRPRTNTIAAVARVRNACAYATHLFFNQRGFKYVHTPIITTADCEGAGEMFSVTTLFGDPNKPMPLTKEGRPDFSQDFFKNHARLTVSGQLNVEAYCTALGDVYTFGPTFRAENSHTLRHLCEFWMIEPEMAFADIYDDMDLAEDYVKFCTAYVLEHCAQDIDFFEKHYENGLKDRLMNCLLNPFARITYTQMIEILNKPENLEKGNFEVKPEWGIDLGSEHERYVTEQVYKKPVIVTGYPKDIKAFYMKLNPDGKTVAAMDILVPKIGELIGGSQREENLILLEKQIAERGMNKEELDWYIDFRRYGTVPHCGFGLGFERLIMYVTGLDNIRDVIPYPRWPKNAKF